MSNKHPFDQAIANTQALAEAFAQQQGIKSPQQVKLEQARARNQQKAVDAAEGARQLSIAQSMPQPYAPSQYETYKNMVETDTVGEIARDAGISTAKVFDAGARGLAHFAGGGIEYAGRTVNSAAEGLGFDAPFESMGTWGKDGSTYKGVVYNWMGDVDPRWKQENFDRNIGEHSDNYKRQQQDIEMALASSDNFLGKSAAVFAATLQAPNVLISEGTATAASMLTGGAIGKVAKALFPSMSVGTAAAIGTTGVSTAAQLADTYKTKGHITGTDFLYDLGSGAVEGVLQKFTPTRLNIEAKIAGDTSTGLTGSIGNRTKQFGQALTVQGLQEGAQEGGSEIVDSIQKTGTVNWDDVALSTGMGAALGTGVTGLTGMSSYILGSTGDTIKAVGNARHQNKVNPEHKNYNPAYATQDANQKLSRVDATTEDIQSATEARNTALETALNKLDEFDTQLASMADGKDKDKLKKERDKYFDTQVKLIQQSVVEAEQVIDLTPDEAFDRIMSLSMDIYNRKKSEAEQRLTDAVNYKPEIPQYTGAVEGGGTDNSQGIDFGIALTNQHQDVAYSIKNGKNIANGLVDCSGWIDVINKNVVSQIEAKYGKEYAKQFRIDSNGGAAGQIQTQVQKGNGVNSADGTLFSKLDKSILKEGMLIGINTGDHAKGRYKSIGHIATVVKQNGQLYISESTTEKYQGKDGVRLITLDEFVNAHSKRGNGQRKAFIVDPYKALRGMQGGISTGTTTNTQQASTGIVTIGDSISNAFGGKYKESGVTAYSQDGRNPDEVLSVISKLGKNELQGKTVVLSTGLSNNSNANLNTIRKQIQHLKANGATVQVMGVANNFKDDTKLGSRMNNDLASIAKDMGVTFLGGFNYAKGDKYKAHPDSSWYKPIYDGIGKSNVAVGQSTGGAKTQYTGISKSQSAYMNMVAAALDKYNLSTEFKKGLLGQIGREGSFNFENLVSGHADDANGQTNIGIISFQKTRRTDLLNFLKGRGLYDGKSIKGSQQELIQANVDFMMKEINEDPRYNKTKQLQQSNDKEAIWLGLSDNYIKWARTNPKYAASGKKNFDTFYRAAEEYYSGGGNSSSYTATTSQGYTQSDTQSDTQSALDKLLSDIDTDEFRAKTEEEQAAMRAEIDSLKAQLAEQNQNQEQNQEQQPTGETSEPTTVEQQVTKEVQEDTFKQVLRFAQVLDDNHLTRLVEAGAISEEHLAQLRELSATKRMLTEMRDTDAVSKTVFEGNTAKTLEESDRGLNTYMLALETAMSSGRTGLAEKILPDLDRWHQSHGTKALAAAKAMQMYQETGEPVHIARKKDSQEWDVYAGKIDKSNRDRTAALNINDSPSSIQLVNSIQNEAKAIAQVHRAYTTALGLPDVTTQIDLSGLQDFEQPVQPSLNNMDAGMNPTRGTPAPVNVERSAPVDINMVNAMATDAMRENRNLPDPMDFEPVTPPTPSVSVNTAPTSTGLVRGHFNSVTDFNTAREQGQVNPNAVWVGRGKVGSSTVSLSNFLQSGNSKKDTEDGTVNVNNLMETVEINGAPVTRIKAGVLGSPIRIQDADKVPKLPQQDRYLVVHDGTADGKLSAHVESANRYMDMLRVSVANNSNMAKALATMAMNPDTEFYSDPMNMSHNFTESKILEQVLPAIRNTLGEKNLGEAKGKLLQDAVSHALTGMGTMMADGQFHSEIKREVIDGVTNYPTLGKYPTTLHTSETLQQWQPTSLASNQEQEVEVQTAPSQNLGQDQQGLQDWNTGLNQDTNVATSSTQDVSSDQQESVNPVSDSSGVIATSAVNPTEQEASVPTEVPTQVPEAIQDNTEVTAKPIVTTRNSKVTTKAKNNTKQAVATGLNKEAVQTAKAPKQVIETEQEVDTVPTEYIKDTPIPKARVNQAVSVQELVSEMGNYRPQTEQPTKIPAELQVKREEARGVIEAIAQFNPHLKVRIQDKDSYADESTKTDSNTIYVDESNPEVLQETAKQLVSKSVAHIADEIDQLTAEDMASFKETEDKLASGELVHEKGTKDAHDHERKRKVMSLRQDLSEIAKTVNMSVGQMLRDKPKIKEQYPDVIARLALATSSHSNLINMGIFDADTKAILKEIKMGRKNTWTTVYENLVDVISRFFGKEAKQHTAYSRLIDALGDASAINAGDYTAVFKQSNTAKIRAFRDADKDTPMTEVKKLLFPVKGSTAEVRHALQAHFKQESSLKRPLSSIPDFVMNLSQDINAATSALGFERNATEAQEKQVMDFVAFNQLFTSYLEQAIKVKKNKDYLYQSKANYFIEEDENGNVSIETNVASALAYAAYDYMMTKGNHQRNTDKEIFGLLGIHDEDVQDAIYLPKEVREAYQYRGVSALTLANSLGSRVAQTLNIKRSSFGSDKMESDLHSALGNWVITAMQGADLIHIQEMPMADHEANIAKLDMNPDDKKALLEESQQTTKANSAFSVARFVSFTDETGEGRNDLLDEIAELNKGTGSFLADIMGGVSMARYPLLKAPKPESVKDKIKRTIAKVSKVQAERVSKAQQESMVVEEDFFALATGLEAEHSDAFHQMIGSQVTQEQLDSKHDRDHAGMLGKAEATKRDWENAVSWITAIPAVNGVREYWDTMFMAVNSRMHLNATVMNIQGSKLHRAMADLKNFKVSIKIKQKAKSTLESMVAKLKDKGSKIKAKDLTNEELKLMFYIRAMGENAEGSEDFIETWIKNSEYAETFKTGFTVDKLPSYVFIPAFLDYMGQDYIQDAMKAVTKQMNGEKLSASEMDKITTAVADMGMGASSLRALMEMTKFHNATESSEASVSLTTSLGLGSDGLNNGAALAHIWNGAIDKKLLDRTGFYVSQSQYRNYFQARHDNTVGDYYTGFVDFLKAALDPNLSDSYIQKAKDKITRLEDELAKAKTKDPAKQEQIQQLEAKLQNIKTIQKVHTALSKRSVAKAILVPFNYGAGMKALGRSVFGEFMKDTQAIMVKAANKDKEAYQRYLDGEISKEEYDVIRETIINDKGKEGKDPSLAELMEVIQDLTGQKTVSLVVENDPTTDGEKYEVKFDTSINPRVLLHAWFDQKTETKLQEVYDNSVGEAVIATLRQYEEDYINAKQVNMELLQANIALFTEVYKKVEAKAIQKVIERDTQYWKDHGFSDEEAKKIAEKEMQIVGLTDQDRQEYVHKIMDGLQAKIHTAYSAERNETGSMIQLTENDSVLKGDTDGISENEFYVMNEDGLLQTFSGNTGIRIRELVGKALLANSAQTQSMDSYISSYAMALGKRININVHDANIGALDNQIDMINHQNKAAFIALASYNGQLESLKALKQTTEAMLELHETKEIELDLSQSGATMGALSALYKQAESVWQNEKNKLDMLMEIETVSQYAGELGEYTITDEDKKLIDKSREQVESVLGKVGETIPKQVLNLAEKYNIKFVKPVEFVSNPRAVKPNYVMGGGTAKTREFKAMMANAGLQYDLGVPDDMKREDNQEASHAAHQWLKHNVKDYPRKGDNALYQNNSMKVTYLSINEADAVYVSDAMYEGKDGRIYTGFKAKEIISYANKLDKPVYLYNQYEKTWLGYDRVKKEFVPTHVGLTSQPAIFEGGGMNADAIMALMGDEVVENAQAQQEPQWGKEVATGQARDGVGEVTYTQYEKGDTTFFVFSNGTVRQIPTKYIGKNISIHSDAFKELMGLYANTDFTKTLLEKQLQLLKYSAHDVYVQFIGTDTSNLSYERLTYLEDGHPIAWSNNSVHSNTIGFNLLHPSNVYYGEVAVHELHHAYTISAITNTTGAPHRDAANNSYFSEVLRLIDQITYAMYHSRVVQSDPYLLESVDYMGTNFHELMTVASSQEPVYELLRKIPASYVMEYSPFTAYAHKELGVPLQANNLAEVIDILSMELASRELSKTKLAKLPEDQGIKNQLKQLTKQQKGNNLDLLRSRTESITRNGADYYFQHSESNSSIRGREEDASQESPNSNYGGNAEDMEGVSSGGLSLPTITNLTELQSYISGLTNAHAFSKNLNKYLMSAVKDFNPKVKIDVSEVTGGYAKYDLSNNTITLDPVIHDPTAADGAKLKLINHELLHALTEASIQSGNPKYDKPINHLYQMMDQVLQAWQSGTTSPELDDILNIIKDLPREQALSEFVAYGMTEPAMAKFIDSTLKPENIKGLTLSKRVSHAFDYFIAAVYSALGLGKTGYKAFAETVHDLMDSFTDLPITPILHRDSMGASDKTNVSQNETGSNDTTRFSQVFDEIHKQSATEVYKRIKDEGITTEWSNHLDSMVSTIYDTHYESLTADMKSVLNESFDTVFSNNPISMTDKESAAYAAVFAVLKHIYEEGTNRHLISELNKVYEQVVNQFATVEDYSPEDYTAAQDMNDKQYMSYIENQFNEIFRDTSSDAIPKVLALILTNQQFSNKTKAKLKLRELKYDTWFDKLMNIWHRLMNFTRTKFVNADNTSDATKKLVTKLVQVDAAVRLQEVNKADQIWNMTYGKAMDLANKANDAAWKLGSKAVMKAADRVVSDGKDTKLSKTLEAAKNVHQYLGELNNHKPLHDTEFTKFAKEHGITDKNLELTHADAAKFGLNSAVEGMLAVTGGDRQLTYGGNQKLKSLTRGILKELANEMLGARGVGLVVQKVGMLANAISQQRADRKKQALQMFERMMKNPESFTNKVKSAITRSILMSDASALLNHHSMDDTLALITSHSKRQARYANLEKQLSKLVKNPEELNHMLIQIKKLGYYMVHETTVEDMVKSSEMIATSTSTQWSVPYDQMNQEVYQIVDEMVTLYALSSVDAKYSRSMPKMIENERQLIEAILNTHQSLVEQSKEDFKDNPLNYNKGYLPALHDTNVDVQSITLDQWEEYRAKGYKLYAEAPIEQDELDTTEPRLLVYNPNHHVSRYVTGALEMKDSHHKGFAVLDYKTHGRELTEVGIKRMARIHETAKTINAKDYNPADYAGSNLIMVVGTDNLITHYQYEMTGKLRDELLVRNLAFDDVLATMDANLYAKPELKETQRDLAKVLIADANNPVSGYKKQPSQYTKLHPESQDPRVQEMLRMMPYEFRHEMELAFGKGKPMYVRTSVFNAVFGFRKYSIAEAFDKEAGDKNVLEKMLTGLYRSLFKDEAVNTAAMHQRIIEAIVTDMKDYIVVRSGKVLLGNIVANLFLLLAEGLTPREIVGHTIYAWKEGKAYRAMQAELIQAQMAIRANPNDKAKVKQLTAKIHSLQRSMEANGMHEYMQRGLMSTIVEDIDMGSETVMFRNKEQRAWDSVTEKVPQPARTALKYLTMHPDTPMHKMMSEATQFSDFAAKYALAKHTEAKAKKAGKSKAEAFELGIQAAQEAFINYDTPTSRGMQLANDLGLFMFTKFMLRFQRVLARQLHSNGGHAIAQHFLVESFLPFAGLLNPLGIVPNVGMSAAGWFSGFTMLPWLSIFL